MTMMHRRSPRRVLLAVAAGVLGAALAFAVGFGGAGHGTSSVSGHHVVADIISWDTVNS